MEKEKKHGLSVEVDYIDEENVKGITIKNLKIENLSTPVMIMIIGVLIQRTKEHIAEMADKDDLCAAAELMALHTTVAGVMSGRLDFDEISNDCQKEFLEHCFDMEHKGE